MSHGAAAAGFDRQTGLSSVERLDLGFLIDRQNHGMRRRVHIEADNVFDLLGEGGIVGTLERADAMRLEVVCLPNALHRAQRQADRLSHRSAGPVGRFAGRLAAGECQYLGHGRGRHWLFPRRPGLVAQQTVHPGIGVAPLPAPHRRTADGGAAGHLKHRQPIRREQNDLGALDVLQRPVPIVNDCRQAGAILRADYDAKLLGHARRIAHPARLMNRSFVSVH